MTTHSPAQSIHAAIPDGEVDENDELVRKSLCSVHAQFSDRSRISRDEAVRAAKRAVIYALTALEAENAALKAKNETQGERLHDMADSLQFASNERAALKAEVAGLRGRA
jgi:hypothetical protein